jgi:hypothetical protein
MQDIISNPWEIALLLGEKAWGKTLVKTQLKSEKWWRNRLKMLLEEIPNIDLPKNNPGIYNIDGTPASIPIPFEDEYPEQAKELVLISNRKHSMIRSVSFNKSGIQIKFKNE